MCFQYVFLILLFYIYAPHVNSFSLIVMNFSCPCICSIIHIFYSIKIQHEKKVICRFEINIKKLKI